jgi:hypothetical protein
VPADGAETVIELAHAKVFKGVEEGRGQEGALAPHAAGHVPKKIGVAAKKCQQSQQR